MDYCIVYLSSSSGLFSTDELTAILQQSRKNNSALGITGILLYFNGSIIQVLEGSEEKVKTLYQTISLDQRHRGITKLYSRIIDKRSFSEWSMGYKTLTASQMDNLKKINDGVNKSFSESANEENAVLGLLKLFYETNARN
ncbi:BLUF domain-containing protein [Larkinella insperata]|uniref:BLUF domain-containing protein n=1 Tax=Larkinella insperata TaxID=332158 RepID=A0ABW3QCK2_9BACT|nr:BLUF domain-containing protein [Larkinella insperata]